MRGGGEGGRREGEGRKGGRERGRDRRKGRGKERGGWKKERGEGMRAISCTCTCGSPEWKSNIIPLHNSTTLLYLKHCNARLLLRAGLICAAKMHEYLMSLCSMYEPHP